MPIPYGGSFLLEARRTCLPEDFTAEHRAIAKPPMISGPVKCPNVEAIQQQDFAF
jgi:hypothetical protein